MTTGEMKAKSKVAGAAGEANGPAGATTGGRRPREGPGLTAQGPKA